jgi:hypothetical protein
MTITNLIPMGPVAFVFVRIFPRVGLVRQTADMITAPETQSKPEQHKPFAA